MAEKKTFKVRRKYPRYDTELKVYFELKYDIETRVEFKVIASTHKENHFHKYSGLSKNVSVEGLCFVSKKKLEKGDVLIIDVYEPKVKGPIVMEGQVRWSKKAPDGAKEKDMFYTGIKLISVNGKLVSDSVYFDKKYNVVWSVVLDSLFGNFSAAIRHTK
jgi:hypothetical protein